MNPTTIQIIGAVLFAVAILHTFSVGVFSRLAGKHPSHEGLFHLLSEVEVAFGLWAGILIVFVALTSIGTDAGPFDGVTAYLEECNYTEPLFVLTIMIVAASKPVLLFASSIVRVISRLMPLPRPVAFYCSVLSVVPLLSSLITEPAAMALAAMILKDTFYRKGMSLRLMYATLGVLFVNISIGGTLTNFAAPPVLMVAGPLKWDWSTTFMFTHIGWRSAVAVVVNAALITLIFHKELIRFELPGSAERSTVPVFVTLLHLLLLLLIVMFAHYPRFFIGALLLFIAFAHAYPRYQNRLIMREGLMVCCFLGGLVTLGGLQAWWLKPLLTSMDVSTVYFGATALTAVSDNAALTYLGSLVEGLSDEFKYALVTGAVTGGGLTVIANAPNPAGISLLRGFFKGGVVNPLGLFAAAIPPTMVAIAAFQLI